MSSSIDERIVRLGFDNAKFESGAAKSMSTIDKLKEKLQFKGAEKGAKNLDRSLNAIDFSTMAKGIESIEKRFSAMGIAGMNVVNKITDSVINGAKRLEQATIGQIKSGGWSRAMNLANAQFQIEGLGEDWNEMQKAISYGVKDTAYGLDAAATAASSLVASGVAYKESIDGANDSLMHTSLRAISGVAAMTNSSYEDISRIFTTVAGNGRLMGDQLLQLSSRGMNVAATLGKALGKTESDIREMVSRGQIDFETFASAMDDAFGAHAKEANKTFTGALSNMKAALSRFGAVFATPVIDKTNTLFISLTSRIDELKNKLGEIKVPRSAKELHDLLDGMNLSAAGFDAASKSLREKTINLGQDFADMWQSGIDAFSAFVTSIDLSWFDKIVERVDNVTLKVKFFFDTLKDYLGESTEETASSINDATKTMLVSAEEAQAARDIIERGLYGNGAKRHNALTELFGGGDEGEQHAKNVQAYINAVAAAGWVYENSAVKIADANEEVAESEEQIGKKSKIIKFLDTAKITFSNLWKVVVNIGKSAKKIGSAIIKAFRNVFKIDFDGVADGVGSFSEALVKLSEKLIISDATGEKITKVFGFFFSVVKKGVSVLSNAAISIKDFFVEFKDTKLFDKISNGFKSFVSSVQNSKVFKWLTDKIKGLLDTTNDYDFFTSIKDKFISMSNSIDTDGFFSGIASKISEIFSSIGDLELPDTTSIGSFFGSIVKIIKKIDWDAVKDNAVAVLFIAGLFKLVQILSSIGTLIESVASVPTKISSLIQSVSDVINIGGQSLSKAANSLLLRALGTVVLEIALSLAILASFPEDDIYRSAVVIAFVAGIMLAIAKKMQDITKSAKSISNEGSGFKLSSVALLIGSFAVGVTILFGALKLISAIPSKDMTKSAIALNVTMIVLAAVMTIMIAAIGKISKNGGKLKPSVVLSISVMIIAFAAALTAIIGAITALTGILMAASLAGTGEEILLAFGLIIVIMGVVGAAMVAIIKAISKLDGLKMVKQLPLVKLLAMLIGVFAIGIIALVAALKLISTIPSDSILSSAIVLNVTMAVLATVMTIMIAAIGKISKNGGKLKTSTVLSISVMIIAFASALTAIIGAIVILGGILMTASLAGMGKEILLAFGLIIVIMGVVGAAIYQIIKAVSKLESRKLSGVSTAFLAISVMIAAIAITISSLATSLPSLKKTAIAVGAIAALMIVVAGAIGLIVKALSKNNGFSGNPKETMIGIGLGFLMLSAAIFVLAAALEKIAGIQSGLAPALVSLAVFAGIIIGLAFATAKIDGFGDAMIRVGEAFLTAGLGVVLVGAGFFLLSKAFAIITAALITFTPHLGAFFDVLEEHKGTAIAVGIGIIIVLGLLTSMISSLANVLAPIIDLIVTALRAILDAIRDFVNDSGKETDEGSSTLSRKTKRAVVGIIAGMIGAISAMTPSMLNAVGQLIIKVLAYLGTIAGDVAEGLVNLLINLINGVARAIRNNSNRIMNAIWNVLVAIASLFIAGLRQLPVIGDLLSDYFDEVDTLLTEGAEERTRAAEETDAAKKDITQSFRGMATEISSTANEMGGSSGGLLSIAKGFLNISDSAESAEDSVTSGMTGISSMFGLSAGSSTNAADEVTAAMESMGLSTDFNSEAMTGDLNDIMSEFGLSAGSSTNAADEVTAAMESMGLSTDFNSEAMTGDLNDVSSQYDLTADSSTEASDTVANSMADMDSAVTTHSKSIVGNLAGVSDAFNQVSKSTEETVKDNIPSKKDGIDMGNGLVTGLIGGITNREHLRDLAKAMTKLTDTAKDQYATDMDQHSPSRVFYRNGQYLVEGLCNGIDNSAAMAASSMENLSDAIVVSFGAPLDYVARIASGELAYDPTIRPTFDPTAVQRGARDINSMVASQQIELSGYTGQLAADISQMDNSNLAVVAELRQLREDMAVMTEEITNMQMVMDTGALVGSIAGSMDSALGQRSVYRRRGN